MAETRAPRKSFLGPIPPRVRLLVYSLAVNNLAVGYFLVYLTGYLPAIGFGAQSVGLIIAVEGSMVILAGIPLGVISDRKGRKWILILASAGVGPAILVFYFTSNIGYYVISAVLLGLAESGTLASWNAILADQTDEASRTSTFSLSFLVSTVLQACGFALPFAFPFLQTATGVSSASLHLWTLAALGVGNLATPAVLWMLLRNHIEVVRPRGPLKRNWGIIWKFTAINALLGFGAGLIIPLIPTWAHLKFGIPDSASGPLLALSNVTIGFAALASPRIGGKLGSVRAIVATTGSSTLFMFSMAFIPTFVPAAGVYVVRSMLMNMSGPLLDSFIMSQVSAEERGFTSAVNSVIWRLPNSASTYIGGALLQGGYYDLPWLLASGLYVAGIASFYFVFRKTAHVV